MELASGVPDVTFIVPTIGRSTLARTLASVQKQTRSSWTCLIGFDGIPATTLLLDTRFQYISLPKVGGNFNFGGGVRNALLQQATGTWAAFVDDDDTLRPQYIETLLHELQKCPNTSQPDCIIFRMSYGPNDRRVLPPKGLKRVLRGQVGISFAVRLAYIRKHNIRFQNGQFEDFEFLEKIRRANGRIHFSDAIMYNIRF